MMLQTLKEASLPRSYPAEFRRKVLDLVEAGRPIRQIAHDLGISERARASGMVPSMGTIGDCYDNAMIESFWGRMQTELLNRRRWRTRLELANAIFEYLEIFHNRQRRHSALGMLTPIEFELRAAPSIA
ncbi:integrase core domain-containing protein [Streptomyces sp. NPDC002577]